MLSQLNNIVSTTLVTSEVKDTLSVIIQVLRDQKIPEKDMELLERGLATVEEKIGKSANEYLGFGKTASNKHKFKYHKNGNYQYVGEFNAKN